MPSMLLFLVIWCWRGFLICGLIYCLWFGWCSCFLLAFLGTGRSSCFSSCSSSYKSSCCCLCCCCLSCFFACPSCSCSSSCSRCACSSCSCPGCCRRRCCCSSASCSRCPRCCDCRFVIYTTQPPHLRPLRYYLNFAAKTFQCFISPLTLVMSPLRISASRFASVNGIYGRVDPCWKRCTFFQLQKPPDACFCLVLVSCILSNIPKESFQICLLSGHFQWATHFQVVQWRFGVLVAFILTVRWWQCYWVLLVLPIVCHC